MRKHLSAIVLMALVFCSVPVRGADDSLRDQAAQVLRKATSFFHKRVSSHGGYLYRYSEDLTKGEGEERGDMKTVWIEPPGTPAVGLVLLDAYDATGEPTYLDAAHDTGMCLVRGQLRSGGWDNLIEFTPKRRERYAYRVDPPRKNARNTTTLDDNKTQSAIRLLMRLDKTLAYQDRQIHEAAEYALRAVLNAQYPNGAWPQRFDAPPDSAKYPIKKARYPESWSRTYPKRDYKGFYTFNDNTIADVVDVMFIAYWTYGDERFLSSAKKAGDFMLAAQMPDPQPAWSQQYNLDMEPAWARKFEPASITGGESQGVMSALLRLYRDTGDKQYLEPIPRALRYLQGSKLSDGRLARFYELKTNKPLYFTRGDYELTYDDSDMPTHYAFKVGNRLDRIEREYERLRMLSPDKLGKPPVASEPRTSESLENLVREVVAALDSQGRWVELGRMRNYGADDGTRRVIESRTFIKNVGILSQYLAATRN